MLGCLGLTPGCPFGFWTCCDIWIWLPGFADILGILVISGNNPELWPGRGIQRGLLEAILENSFCPKKSPLRYGCLVASLEGTELKPPIQGTIIENGTVDELRKANGPFAAMLKVPWRRLTWAFGLWTLDDFGWKWKYLNSCCRPEPQPTEYFELRSNCRN